MGWQAATRFWTKGARTRVFPTLDKAPTERWEYLKDQVNKLIVKGRLCVEPNRANEIRRCAEEIIRYAKKDTWPNDVKVESMIVNSEARARLFEELVPLYRYRRDCVRVVETPKYLNAKPIAFVELIDQDNEMRPAEPVGENRGIYLWSEMQQSRRARRQLEGEAVHQRIVRGRRIGDRPGKQEDERTRPFGHVDVWLPDETKRTIPMTKTVFKKQPDRDVRTVVGF
eukprot:GHVN01091458.1.p1 GENE.GHVN01091458.1~~GHVN01091458.1.p1  ORF type:complete len:227 (+),score=35.96 GHVN01091458.1:34-714(+)